MTILRLFSVLIGAALLFAPAANADPYEFVAELDARGVYYADITTVIDDGKLACHQLRGGARILDMMDDIVDGGYTGIESGILIRTAVKWMCPDQQDVVDAFTREAIAAQQRES